MYLLQYRCSSGERRELNITTLPEMILLIIFSYLTIHGKARVARVCKRWERVSNDHTLWHNTEARLNLTQRFDWRMIAQCLEMRRINWINIIAFSGQTQLGKLFKNSAHFIKILDLSYTELFMDCFKSSLPNLRSLSLQNSTIKTRFRSFHSQDLHKLFKMMYNLEELSMCRLKIDGISNPGNCVLPAISECLPNLKDLDLSYTQLRLDIINILFVNNWGKSLQKLSVRGPSPRPCYEILSDLSTCIPHIHHLDISRTRLDNLSNFKSLFPNLCSIDLSFINLKYTAVELCLSPVAPCHQVKAVDLSSNSWLSDDHVAAIVQTFPNLQVLNLNNCNKITSKSAYMIARTLTRLRVLCIDCLELDDDERLWMLVNKNLQKLYSLEIGRHDVGASRLPYPKMAYVNRRLLECNHDPYGSVFFKPKSSVLTTHYD